jgi:hypothetical protein
MEAVAAAGHRLPPGGIVPQDYVFHGWGPDGGVAGVRLSELFRGRAKEAPGTAALNQGRDAETNFSGPSCSSVGNCSAGGSYTDSSAHGQVFVVDEVNGSWAKAEEIPATAVLNQGGSAQVSSVSCAPAGNCSAGGVYIDSSGHLQASVVNKA